MARQQPQSPETVLVTGASAGIGSGLAEIFAQNGCDLVLVARRQAELESLAERCRSEYGVRAETIPLDLLTPDAPAQLVAQLDAAGLAIDVLVNNAGLMEMGRFAEIDLEKHDRLLRLNVLVLTSLTHRLLQPMLARGHGRILNVASTSSFQPVPSLALYAASKAFVLSFSESLSEELKGTGVTTTVLCPGFTRTDMLEGAQDEHSAARMLPGFVLSDVEDVARAGYEACMAGETIIVPGLPNRVAASLVSLYPRWLVRTVGGIVGRHAT
jgi:short-subunit dehydrogenase